MALERINDDDRVSVDEKRLLKNFKVGTMPPAELEFLLKRLTGHIRRKHKTLMSEADEIASDAVIEAYAQIENLREDKKFNAWLMKITYGEIAKRAKILKRQPTIISRDAAPVQTNEISPEGAEALWKQSGFVDADIALLRRWALDDARGILTDEEQRIIHLRIDEQFSSKEVAEKIGKKDDAIRQIETRACRKMFERLVVNGDWELFVTEAEMLRRQGKKPERQSRQPAVKS